MNHASVHMIPSCRDASAELCAFLDADDLAVSVCCHGNTHDVRDTVEVSIAGQQAGVVAEGNGGDHDHTHPDGRGDGERHEHHQAQPADQGG